MYTRIALGLGVLVFVGALVVNGTGAFFSDTAEATGNSFTSGTLDLQLTRVQGGPNPEDTKDAEWDFDELVPGGDSVEESVWLINTGSVDGESVDVALDFEGGGGNNNFAGQLRLTTLTWDGNNLLEGGAGANLDNYEAPTNCDWEVNFGDNDHSTISDAITAASNGDVICAQGTDFSSAWESGSITVNKEVTIVSANGAASKISAGILVTADNVTIQGFTITPSGNNGVALTTDGDRSDVTIRDNAFSNGGFTGSTRGVVLGSDTMFDLLIENNTFDGLRSGIFTDHTNGGPNNVDIMHNTFTNNFAGIGGLHGATVTLNEFSDNDEEAIGVNGTGSSVVFDQNNILNGDIVRNYVGGTLDAQNNWWGDFDPSDSVDNTGGGSVDTSNFAMGPFTGLVNGTDQNGNGYADLHDLKQADITNATPGLASGEEKEFVMAVQLDGSTGNSFQGQTLDDIDITFTLNQVAN